MIHVPNNNVNTESANSQEVTSSETYEEQLARRIEAKRIETAKKYNIPLWMLTRPVEPHMQESPEELD